MVQEKEIDIRTRLIALAAAIVLVLSLAAGYKFVRKHFYRYWYKDQERVVKRMHSECSEMINYVRSSRKMAQMSDDERSQWYSRALDECRMIKEECQKNFQQEMCLLAQKQFQEPQ